MKILKTIREIKIELFNKNNISFVPTMGNIHDGHLFLIRKAKEKSRFLVCSIFVNQLQFEDKIDFVSYPRTIERDIKLLRLAGVDLLFIPSNSEIFPVKQNFIVKPPKNISSILEGEYRPGFFEGVATIVLKLFNIVQPNIAFFGKKDFQQALIIKAMCSQLQINTSIKTVETMRDESGLAFSSRNIRLSSKEKKEAPFLFECLNEISEKIIDLYKNHNINNSELENLETQTLKKLKANGWNPEYISIRNKKTFGTPKSFTSEEMSNLIILSAAWLGKTRLIDNLEISVL